LKNNQNFKKKDNPYEQIKQDDIVNSSKELSKMRKERRNSAIAQNNGA
jgi:hypothetical protein